MDIRSDVSRVLEAFGLAALCTIAGVGCASSDDPAELSSTAQAVLVSPEFEIDPPDLGPAAGEQATALFERAGDHTLAIWTDNRATFELNPGAQRHEFMGARIDPSGTVLDPTGFRIGPGPVIGGTFAVGCNPDGLCLLVISGTALDPQSRTVGIRILENQVLDATPIVLSGPGSRQATVAWDGAAFRVLWPILPGGSFLRTVDEDGTLGATVPVPVPELDSFNAVPQIDCGGPRCLLTYRKSNGIDFDVMGRMLDVDGSVSAEFAISAGPISHNPSGAVWDGARYWIAVEAVVANPIPVRLLRVEADGTILDPDGVQVGTTPSVGSIGLRAAGTHLVLSWQVSTTGNVAEVRNARVAFDGDVLDPGGVPFVITTPPGRFEFEVFGGLNCHGESCMFFARHQNDVDAWMRGFRLEGATVVDPEGVIVTASPPGQVDAAATFGSGRYLAVWQDSRLSDRDPLAFRLRGALFSPAMDAFAPFETDPPLDASMRLAAQKKPAAAASASSYLVAWSAAVPPRKPNIYAEVFGPNGQPIRTTFAVHDTTRLEDNPTAASSGDGFLVVWERLDSSNVHALRASRFNASGAALAPEQFLVTGNGFLPAAGFDGESYVVVWQRPKSPTDAKRDVVAARVSTEGPVLDPTGIVIADSAAIDHSHSIGCGGGRCLIVWHTAPSQVRALRLAQDGTVLDPGGFLVATAKGVAATSVVFDGSSFVVVWRTNTGDMNGAAVSPSGVVSEAAFLIANEATALQNPIAASDGAGHRLVLYDRNDPSSDYNVRRVRARVLDFAGP
jgi:hypothetical protein